MLPNPPETEILPLLDPHLVAVLARGDAQETVRRTLKRELCELLTTDRPGEFLGWLGGRRVSLALVDASSVHLLPEARRRAPDVAYVLLGGDAGDRPIDGVRWVLEDPWGEEAVRRIVRHLLRERELSRRTHQQAQAVEDAPEERELGVGD